MSERVDLFVDLNSEDDTGLPWGLLEDAVDPTLVVEGAWLIVGAGSVAAVAQVADIDDGVVHVQPLRGPVSSHRHLLDKPIPA